MAVANISDIIDAFYVKKRKKRKNDFTEDGCLYFHGNKIAELTENGVIISLCGWNTPSTRGRLSQLNGVFIKKDKGITFLNGIPWLGQSKEILL